MEKEKSSSALEVDSADPGQFDEADADFLAGFAGLLGIAIERQQADAKLQEALEHQALLTREMSHRVKNSLTSVVGLLRVQARSALSQDVKNALEEASLRVATIARVHDHLWRSSHVGFVELVDFMSELCKKLKGTTDGHTLHCRAYQTRFACAHLPNENPSAQVRLRSSARISKSMLVALQIEANWSETAWLGFTEAPLGICTSCAQRD